MRFASVIVFQGLALSALMGIASAEPKAYKADGVDKAMAQMAQKRQLLPVLGGGSPTAPASASSAPTSDVSSPSDSPSPSSNTSDSSSDTPTPTAPSSSSTTDPSSSTTPPPSTTSHASKSEHSSFQVTVYETIVTSGTHVYSSAVSSSLLVPAETSTAAPSLNGSDGSSTSNMSPKTRALVGGLVGGIGGALFLGGIAIVIWRLRQKRQRRYNVDDDSFGVGANDPLTHKEGRHGSPFQSTLDQYHTPAGRPNASSNF